MTRKLYILSHEIARQNALNAVRNAPDGYRVEIKEVKRNLEQNAKFWAMLTDISKQATLRGSKMNTEQWKVVFLQAIGREVEFLPSLSGQGGIPYIPSSSDLSVGEMRTVIDFMQEWGVMNGVVFGGKAEE